jgi:hypothetical protein
VRVYKQKWLRKEFMPIKSLKVCSMILDFFEARVNTEETKDNYIIVYASPSEIAYMLGFTREYISSLH